MKISTSHVVANRRETQGTSASRRLRRSGKVQVLFMAVRLSPSPLK